MEENEEYFIIAKTCPAQEIHRLTRCQINTSNWLAAGVLHIAFVLRYPPLSSSVVHIHYACTYVNGEWNSTQSIQETNHNNVAN